MNFFRIIILSLILIFGTSQILFAADETTAVENENFDKDMDQDEEEDVPLNDPFAGNAATSGNTSYSLTSSDQEEQRNELSLYNFKLVGIISGSFDSYVSLVNATGEVITLGIFEELSDGVKLVDMRLHEAVFQKSDGKYLIIDFKNQIVEKDEY